MMLATEHLIIAPILIPLIAGALMLLYDESQRKAKLGISIGSTIALLFVAIELLNRSKGSPLSGGNEISFYLLGDWAVPFGIILVLDRLSALMLLLVALLAIPTMIYAGANWHKQGQHFNSMFQFLLMGLNGAFLTGDIFNLFVFFEVLLAASYGLLLHGSGQVKVRAGIHYIAMNLAGSLFFLIGVALIYGVTGTLSMAHLSQMVVNIPASERPLFHAGAAIMGVAFLVKAGLWPLSFWLPITYMASAAPVAAMFSVMTKVGVYVILRLSMLFFGLGAGASAGFGAEVLIWGGMATMVFGMLGVLSSQSLGRMAAHLVLISSGTVLAVIGLALSGGGSSMLSGALYYMVSSTLATATLFLLLEPMSREEGGIAAMLALTADAYGLEKDEDEDEEVGLAIPGTMTILGLSFGVCLLVLAGLPPLSGFIGKVAILSGMLGVGGVPAYLTWTFLAVLMISGFATILGLVRIGIQTFWASDSKPPKVLAMEFAPVILLVAMMLAITVRGDSVLRYTDATSRALHDPLVYSDGVFSTRRTVGAEDQE
ncbi:monovalent cation/H+ antiporter subunit D [Pseudomonas sp. GX19020]|uniref:monovalent cation/H+ antiporter subunit D n=1 Tax=Pseudomonadota TaxID=1224 RepID=UPI0008955818|nr:MULTISPECIES: monovalent cation/H+ antiporter subunit D [Pseudomonadota]MCL4067618.1 monovalent cation/H+ antiporter subunit D [Pseudomonas sp. GX19020]SEC48126.1 multisubunit potassium/proton antiporter, PhaD subunit [Rhodobacter sp. 24-YEA-8]